MNIILKPREIISYIEERRSFNRVLSGKTKLDKYSMERVYKTLRRKTYADSSKAYRKFITGVIIKLRNMLPYEVIDFSKAKKAYEEFVAEGGIVNIEDVKLGDWVTCIRTGYSDIPAKGERYADYYLNGSGMGHIGEAYKITRRYKSDDSVSVEGSDMGFMLGQFRLSTKEEIKNKPFIHHKRETKKIYAYIKTKESQIEEEYDKIKELDKQLNEAIEQFDKKPNKEE